MDPKSIGVFGLIVGGAVLLAVYFVPTIVAGMRGHRNFWAILLLNLFLGWMLIGWVGALVWAVLAKPEIPPPSPAPSARD